mmetsp:Transcript_12288/g.31425  ORF Transcript_12288/g.31425 Transcript_12288/m.31425 type:complete len:235 (+) Transcript_12288:514-1218(+)
MGAAMRRQPACEKGPRHDDDCRDGVHNAHESGRVARASGINEDDREADVPVDGNREDEAGKEDGHKSAQPGAVAQANQGNGHDGERRCRDHEPDVEFAPGGCGHEVLREACCDAAHDGEEGAQRQQQHALAVRIPKLGGHVLGQVTGPHVEQGEATVHQHGEPRAAIGEEEARGGGEAEGIDGTDLRRAAAAVLLLAAAVAAGGSWAGIGAGAGAGEERGRIKARLHETAPEEN